MGFALKYISRAVNNLKMFFRGALSEWKAVLVITLCSLLSAFAVANFTLPYRFPDMGVSGMAFLAHYAFGFSPSPIIAAANALLMIWGWKNLNLRFLGLTICSIAAFTISLPFFIEMGLPLPRDKFMATVISGVLKGVAGGVIFNMGGSGGGTDILATVMRRRHGLDVGQFTIFANLGILLLSLGVVGLDSVVYGAVGLYVYGITVDNVMRKFDRRKQAFIITNVPDEVSAFITAKGKGVTRIEGRGMYTGEPRPMLISLLEPRQVVQLKGFLQEKDPKAFVSICDAAEVLGRGFKSWQSL